MPIGTVAFDLSLVSPETGEYLTARTYTVDGVLGVDNQPRQLSIGQLVMAICLQRATALEADIVELMEDMNQNSVKLELMTQIETDILDGGANMDNINTSHVTYEGRDYDFRAFLVNVVRMDAASVPSDFVSATDSDFITALEAKMDEMNSFSQQKMIELQSQTSKRDQSYDMISNVLKSLNTVQVGIVNNM
jgi:hypothetical protein